MKRCTWPRVFTHHGFTFADGDAEAHTPRLDAMARTERWPNTRIGIPLETVGRRSPHAVRPAHDVPKLHAFLLL